MRVKNLLVVLLLFVSIFIAGCSASELKTLEENWEIKIPKDATLKYMNKTPTNKQLYVRYLVFEFPDEPTEFLENFSKRINFFIQLEAENHYDRLEIPEDKKPDWESSYYFRKLTKNKLPNSEEYNDVLIMAYFLETKELIISEMSYNKLS
ncbi:MAG TPA: hypothetical protein GX740_04280 [Acholeplasmataceae bacterium]|nr:hypothetical protein [Acholeplasmataceae bacterium]